MTIVGKKEEEVGKKSQIAELFPLQATQPNVVSTKSSFKTVTVFITFYSTLDC